MAEIDGSIYGAQVVNTYDSQIDDLMEAIAAYVNPAEGCDGHTYDHIGVNPETGALGGGAHALYLNRVGDTNVYEDADGNEYMLTESPDGIRAVQINVTLGNIGISATQVENPGFQLVTATETGEITNNISFVTKTIVDKNAIPKMIQQKVS